MLAAGLVLTLAGLVFGDVIVGFERSGEMINIPTGRVLDPRFFSIGGSISMKERLGTSQNAVRFNIGTPGGVELSLSGYKSAVAVHVQKGLFDNGRVAISLGVQNVFFKSAVEDTLLEEPSFYTVFDNHLASFFGLNVHLGVGTNRFVYYGRRDTDNYGVFGGISRQFGPVRLMFEYDSQNFNLGTRATVSEGVDLLLSIMGVEHIGSSTNDIECTRFAGGFVFNVSRIPERLVERKPEVEAKEAVMPSPEREPLFMIPEWESTLRDSLNFYRKRAESLADTLERYKYTLKNLQDYLAYSKQRLIVLEDSLHTYREKEEETQRGLNQALRLLTLSLRSFYAGDYATASAQIRQAIAISPNIALAYARLGSVYYKMGQIDEATVAWEKALELDPNFEDVRNILNSLHGSRLRTMGLRTKSKR